MKQIILSLVFGLLYIQANAQDFSQVKITTQKLTDNIHVLFGAGGNIAIITGPDGTLQIDNQYAPLSEKIKAAIAEITPNPVKYLINTHWHGDHTGGNSNFAKDGSIIVAQDNVRVRMNKENYNDLFRRTTPASPKDALPILTFSDNMHFFLNGEEIAVMHLGRAHTDGDAIIHFKTSNIIHMGDNYFAGNYPFIDLSSGGSVKGVINTFERVLAMTNNDTKIIPGHGPMMTPQGIRESKALVEKIYSIVEKWVKDGRTLEETIAANPLAEFNDTWGKGFIRPDAMVMILYKDITSNKE